MTGFKAILLALGVAAFAAGPGLAAGGEAGSSSAIDRFLGNQPQFFRLLPFNIPVIQDGRVVNQVSLIVSIETFGLADKEKVMAARYKLQNAFLRDLYGVVAVHHGSGHPVIAESVKIRLKRLARDMLGGDVVKDVLIEAAINMRLSR
ncbi:MAG: hypothetical protein OEO83_12180 [Alphaproteobacteria bacterium]|nr:hypothetical protein [Alphaproteobacteria bacterium]